MRSPHCAVSWMVPFRDAKENLVTNRDDPFAIGQRCAANTLTFRAHAPIPYNPMFATLDLKFAHLDGFHVSGLVSAIRIVSATISRSNRTRCELRGSRLSGLHSIARTSAFRGPKIR
jgi:hypothetical protein